MNNNPPPDPRDRLWLDLSVSGSAPSEEHAFAHQVARQIRRRRALRRTAAVAAFALVPALSLLYPFLDDTRRPASVADRPVETPEISSSGHQPVERITDDELLALIPDTPLLIMNEPDGGRRIILLADNTP